MWLIIWGNLRTMPTFLPLLYFGPRKANLVPLRPMILGVWVWTSPQFKRRWLMFSLPAPIRKFLRPLIPRVPRLFSSSRSSIPKKLLFSIQEATFRYHFDGVQCVKNPFDLALYTMLLSGLRPKTIIEIGSANGGSGLWLAAQSRGLGLGAKIYSFDI